MVVVRELAEVVQKVALMCKQGKCHIHATGGMVVNKISMVRMMMTIIWRTFECTGQDQYWQKCQKPTCLVHMWKSNNLCVKFHIVLKALSSLLAYRMHLRIYAMIDLLERYKAEMLE